MGTKESSRYEMEITDIRSYVLTDQLWKPWFIVVVETDEGVTGVGQAEANTDSRAKDAHVGKVREWFLGRDPLNIERLRTTSQETPWGLWRLNQTLFSAVEIACWDIKGKHHGVPVVDLLGGAVRDSVRAYANRWYGGCDSPTEWADAAASVVESGFDAIKFDPFEDATREISNADLRAVEDRVAGIREAVGPDPELFIEGHGRFTPATAIRIGQRLEPYEIGWFEAPVQAHQGPEAYREVREALTIPIADDMAGTDSKFDAFQFISARAVDVIQPDPVIAGGLRETQYIAQMADAASIQTCPHAAAGPVSLTANVHVSAAIPNFKIQEADTFTHPDWVDDVIETPLTVENTRIPVPEGRGLGVEFDEAAAVEHTGELTAEHNVHSASFKESFE